MKWQWLSYIPSLFKKINTPYKMVISNAETMQEAVNVELTKKSIYIVVSTLFVIVFLFFMAIIFFTPLKYYLPGYNADGNRKKIILLQKSTDSLIALNHQHEVYLYNLINVANGNVGEIQKDTTNLSKSEIEAANNAFLHNIKSANNLRKLLPKPKKDTLKSEVKEEVIADSTKS